MWGSVADSIRSSAARIQGSAFRARAEEAAALIAEAMAVDPTLGDVDREMRRCDLLAELMRQLGPLSRQAALLQEARRLDGITGEEADMARLRIGRVNLLAQEETDALLDRLDFLAAELRAAAWPDWDSPARRTQRALATLPGEGRLETIAEELRRAVAPSLAHAPTPEAMRLLALADLIAARPGVCAGPGCEAELPGPASTGRPRRFCCDACRRRGHRRTRTPA